MSCHRAFHHIRCSKYQSIYVLPLSLPPQQVQQIPEYLCPATEPSTTSGAASTRVSMSCQIAFHPHQLQQVPEYLCPATEPSTHISCSKDQSIYVLPLSLLPTSAAASTTVSMSCHRAFHPHQVQQVPEYLCPATEPSTTSAAARTRVSMSCH